MVKTQETLKRLTQFSTAHSKERERVGERQRGAFLAPASIVLFGQSDTNEIKLAVSRFVISDSFRFLS